MVFYIMQIIYVYICSYSMMRHSMYRVVRSGGRFFVKSSLYRGYQTVNNARKKYDMSGIKKKVNHLAVFKQRTKNDDNAELSDVVIISARKTGHLNLSSRGLYTGICNI